MTDLLHTLPAFPTSSYTHLLPSLEKNLITTVDLLTLDALEIAKRAQLPVLDVRRLANAVVVALQGDLGVSNEIGEAGPTAANDSGRHCIDVVSKGDVQLRRKGADIVRRWKTISTLDDQLDAALGGGIPTGYITEITGESGAGKTQILLSLLLSAQLPPPQGLSTPTIYISTEAPLSTPRLSQLLSSHPRLTNLPPSASAPSLSRILSIQTPDLESQDHILRYQLPVAIVRHKIGLVILDSVAANYRAEFDRPEARSGGAAMGARSAELAKLGQLLRELARKHNVAIVVANQVADRFAPTPMVKAAYSLFVGGTPSSPLVSRSHDPPPAPLPSSSPSMTALSSSGPMAPETGGMAGSQAASLADPMALDHQQRWFTGWGDEGAASRSDETAVEKSFKTPALGLVWANQIACRIALIKEPVHAESDGVGEYEDRGRRLVRWRRWMKVVFTPWVEGVVQGNGVEFEITAKGIQSVTAANQE